MNRSARRHARTTTHATPRRVGILVFDGMTTLDAVGPADAFASATFAVDAAGSKGRAYDVVTLAVQRRTCTSESGVAIHAASVLESESALDILVVPGGPGLREPGTQRRVATWLKENPTRYRRLVSVCTGIYGVAPSGLLDGRRVTTHWRYAADVARRFPALRVDPNVLYIRDGRFYTSAGVTAGIDLALALIEEDLGPSIALAVARELVVYLRRSGGQEQFSEPLRFQAATSDRLHELVAYVTAHLTGDLSVEALARRVALSPRQLTRQCLAAFASGPAALVQRMRLDEARERLLLPEATVESVADSVGFHSADAFRRAFERRFGVNPSDYRGRFSREHAWAEKDVRS